LSSQFRGIFDVFSRESDQPRRDVAGSRKLRDLSRPFQGY
jgi:hypothetical protein